LGARRWSGPVDDVEDDRGRTSLNKLQSGRDRRYLGLLLRFDSELPLGPVLQHQSDAMLRRGHRSVHLLGGVTVLLVFAKVLHQAAVWVFHLLRLLGVRGLELPKR
jgi:hypothetical protein